jgi:hypothetical protein
MKGTKAVLNLTHSTQADSHPELELERDKGQHKKHWHNTSLIPSAWQM